MSWLQFWKHNEDDADTGHDAPGEARERPDPGRMTTSQRLVPPHFAAALAASGQRPRFEGHALIQDLNRRRQDILFEIAQGELAASEDNPWRERMELLTEAMATVDDDLKALDAAPREPYAPLPDTPIAGITVQTTEPPEVSFTIADQTFRYSEDLDWAERGHQVIRTELIRRAGDPGALVPGTTPDELKARLTAHLAESVFAFASDMRDRTLDGDPLPDHPTLADLGRPCPVCGGWMEWGDVCQACARRKAERFRLMGERSDLLSKRAGEADERSRLAERLPLARRRLSDVETEIRVAESKLAVSER